MKNYKVYLILISLVTVVSCSTTIPNATSDNAVVYQQQCGSCHAVPHPKRLSYQAWINLIPEMDKRLTERGRDTINKADKEKILAYLKSNAR